MNLIEPGSVVLQGDLLAQSTGTCIAGSAALHALWTGLEKVGYLKSGPNFEPGDVDTWYFARDDTVRSRVVKDDSDHILLNTTIEDLPYMGFDLPCCRVAIATPGSGSSNIAVTTYQCLSALLTGVQCIPFASDKEEYMVAHYGQHVYDHLINSELFKLAKKKITNTLDRKYKYAQRGIVTKHISLKNPEIVYDHIAAYFAFARGYLRFTITYYLNGCTDLEDKKWPANFSKEDKALIKEAAEKNVAMVVQYGELLVKLNQGPQLTAKYLAMLDRDFNLQPSSEMESAAIAHSRLE
jgi:hypothetical protein